MKKANFPLYMWQIRHSLVSIVHSYILLFYIYQLSFIRYMSTLIYGQHGHTHKFWYLKTISNQFNFSSIKKNRLQDQIPWINKLRSISFSLRFHISFCFSFIELLSSIVKRFFSIDCRCYNLIRYDSKSIW